MRRVLLVAATTGYQTRAFEQAAARLDVELVYATDRCHVIEDPWRDRAIPVRFEDEQASTDRVVARAREAPFDGVLAVEVNGEEVAEFGEEKLTVGALGRAGFGPARDEGVSGHGAGG